MINYKLAFIIGYGISFSLLMLSLFVTWLIELFTKGKENVKR